MKKYCLIVDNQISVGPTNLPKNIDTISNFNLLSDQELKIYGWLPYTEVDQQQENQIFVDTTIVITENEVIETKNYRNLTQAEIDEKNTNLILKKWKEIRNKRNALLTKSDWTQLSDNSVDKIAWANYRTLLRSIPQDYVDPFSVVWPTPPNQ